MKRDFSNKINVIEKYALLVNINLSDSDKNLLDWYFNYLINTGVSYMKLINDLDSKIIRINKENIKLLVDRYILLAQTSYEKLTGKRIENDNNESMNNSNSNSKVLVKSNGIKLFDNDEIISNAA